jgi:hypothetical protein
MNATKTRAQARARLGDLLDEWMRVYWQTPTQKNGYHFPRTMNRLSKIRREELEIFEQFGGASEIFTDDGSTAE